ncbi:MAG: hypothetical protein AB7O38_26060 [Pirellulaceae bacterium]
MVSHTALSETPQPPVTDRPADDLAALEGEVIDRDYVLRKAVQILERALSEARPATDRRNRPKLDPATGQQLWVYDGATAIKALRIIGEHRTVDAFRPEPVADASMQIVAILQSGRDRLRWGDGVPPTIEPEEPVELVFERLGNQGVNHV